MPAALDVLGVKFQLVERDMSDEPKTPMEGLGYVRQPGSDTLKRARWSGGRFLDHRHQPFDPAPTVWYSLTSIRHA